MMDGALTNCQMASGQAVAAGLVFWRCEHRRHISYGFTAGSLPV